jgi:hypothetical protein
MEVHCRRYRLECVERLDIPNREIREFQPNLLRRRHLRQLHWLYLAQ